MLNHSTSKKAAILWLSAFFDFIFELIEDLKKIDQDAQITKILSNISPFEKENPILRTNYEEFSENLLFLNKEILGNLEALIQKIPLTKNLFDRSFINNLAELLRDYKAGTKRKGNVINLKDDLFQKIKLITPSEIQTIEKSGGFKNIVEEPNQVVGDKTPLHIAIDSNDINGIITLLDYGADPKKETKLGSPYIYAKIKNNIGVVDIFSKHLEPKTILKEELQAVNLFPKPISEADIISAKINKELYDGFSPIMLLLQLKTYPFDPTSLIKLLLDFGADISIRDKYRKSALGYACARRQEKKELFDPIIKMLAEASEKRRS